MTSRDDLNRYQAAVDGVVNLARADLDDIMRLVLGLSPEAARNELLAILPSLTDTYGDLVASAAAEWYEEIRAASLGGSFNALAAAPAPTEAVEGAVRFAAGHLFTDDPSGTAAVLSGAVQKYVSYAGRATVARNVQLDPSKPRFARVPRGPKTCAWCLMLSSRGWVFHTKASAGDLGRGVGDDFHADCNCQVTPQWDAGEVHFDGYDPDTMYALYLQAREISGSPNQKDITAAIRELGDVTDAHVH